MTEDSVVKRSGVVVHPLPEGASKLVDVKFFGTAVVAIDDQRRAWSGHIDDAGVMHWECVTV